MIELLPISEKETLKFNHFPTDVHAVVFRLWNMVSCKKIAQVLCTSEENIYKIADSMHLGKQESLEHWMEKGYITIIKALWHLMPYEQIMQILDWDDQRLAYILKEDDFLGIKLGSEKPHCEKVLYREFTEEEKNREKEIAKILDATVNKYELADKKSASFDFFNLPYDKFSEKQLKEVAIDNEWSIELMDENDDIKLYVKDFADYILSSFGVTLKAKSDKKIIISTSSVMAYEEDHEIVVEDNFIKITGASPLGVMRALYYLMSLAESSGTLSFDKKHYKRKTKIKSRIIYSFCGLYGDVLDKDNTISFPEKLLKEYAMRGINGVWIQAVLYKLVPFVYDESISEGWENRIKNLNNLIERAKKYGIKIYLYINEPRSMPLSFFEKYPHLKGHDNKDNSASLCTSVPEVRQYVYDTFSKFTSMVPGLGGFWNICMSENLTHCHSRQDVPMNCPRCASKRPYEVASEIVSVMINAVHSVDKSMKFFVNSWAFDSFCTSEEIVKFFNSIPKDTVVTAISESRVPVERGGVETQVDDYSISNVGPGQLAKNIWSAARNAGIGIGAKVQINTTWECSTAPFLPVYDKVLEHLDNLLKENVEHLFLSWTLGGYVSDNLMIASSYFFEDENNNSDIYTDILKSAYGEYHETVKKAVRLFSDGFSQYPFHIDHIYFGPSNFGVANLFFENKTDATATMTAYPYDDVKTWCGPYTHDILISQYEKLCALWEKGLAEIENMPVCEFSDMAYYGYSLFKSSLNQLKYYKLRDAGEKGEEMINVIKDEMNLSSDVYKLMVRNCCIGYEAANHYYAHKTMIAEKLVQCDYLINKLK